MTNTKKTILITGCQRSGATLLKLILDAHPDIEGMDEIDYNPKAYRAHRQDADSAPFISLTLPAISHDLEHIKGIPGIRVLWPIRDPRDVVLSMLKLLLSTDKGQLIPWVSHPAGAFAEIEQAVTTLTPMSEKSAAYLTRYKQIRPKPPSSWTYREQVFVGALCWRLKHEVLNLYSEFGIPYQLVYYEQLVQDPEEVLSEILPHLGLEWHNNLLKHHKSHQSVPTGSTLNSRPMDAGNIEKWRTDMGANSQSIVKHVCADIADHVGYVLNEQAR